MSERFPGIDWYCDRCGAGLNTQAGFDDHRYIWPCTKCGHKNSISSGNIYESHDDYHGVADESEDEGGESLSV
jgi:DNA-directed RNA polymerase subunit M/transcription elongation factor TFIIS